MVFNVNDFKYQEKGRKGGNKEEKEAGESGKGNTKSVTIKKMSKTEMDIWCPLLPYCCY